MGRLDEEAAAADHYSVLGLPSGEEGSKLSQKVIRKAYYVKAMVLHPDKRPADSHSAAAAHRDFQKLLNSYEILKEERSRKRFDDECKAARDAAKRRKVDPKAPNEAASAAEAAAEAEFRRRAEELRYVLEVTWTRKNRDYTRDELRELLAEFGDSKFVYDMGFKKKGRVAFAMSSREALLSASKRGRVTLTHQVPSQLFISTHLS
ncbi:unnamed protein product [Cuscuta epithymum]|uniref:J domain-containing protein n=1 Tax=Cuscuta epithymum TaxID=186058 RepID=A0AAV0FRW9_9ASTE|nr:unnamed protein product [Cuscuta epithymum]